MIDLQAKITQSAFGHLVGTNLAKDRLASRLEVTTPGPGYIHLSNENSDEWFRQMAADDAAVADDDIFRPILL